MIKTINGQLVITRKMSGTGSIYDLESDQFDRCILLSSRTEFVVVLPAYYGGRGFSRHNTLHAAIKRYRKEQRDGYNPVLLSRDAKKMLVMRGNDGEWTAVDR